MATNKLMEAAAEVLANSMKTSPKMPIQKYGGMTPGNEGTPEMTGGPTNPVDSNTDDPYKDQKIDATKGLPDNAAKNAASIKTKKSAASDKKEEMKEEEVISEMENKDEEDEKAEKAGKKVTKDIEYDEKMKKEMKKQMKEDIDEMFSDDKDVSDDFKSKAVTIFEARVYDRVSQIHEKMESEYSTILAESVETVKKELTEKVDDYLNYVVEQWLKDNEIAIESGLRSEITEDFIAGLRKLFAENYINVPEDKVDLVEELGSKVEELETKLNEEIQTNIENTKVLKESKKNQITQQICEGLTDTQLEKIKTLAESVDFSTEDEYKEKIETIRENYFPSGVKKASAEQLHEQVEDTSDETKVSADPFVAAVSKAISQTKK